MQYLSCAMWAGRGNWVTVYDVIVIFMVKSSPLRVGYQEDLLTSYNSERELLI